MRPSGRDSGGVPVLSASEPRRTCVGCRRVGAPHTLLRCAVTPDGVALGRTLPGRGAWICPGEDCMRLALHRGTLARALQLRREAIGPERAEQLVAACAAVTTRETEVTDGDGSERVPRV